jgi:hypothetical protein
MDPGEGGFMADGEDLELENEEVEDEWSWLDEIDEFLGDAEFEEVAAIGGALGAALEHHERRLRQAAVASDAEVDEAIDLIASETRGYCRLKGIWRDNPSLARHLYRKIYGKD